MTDLGSTRGAIRLAVDRDLVVTQEEELLDQGPERQGVAVEQRRESLVILSAGEELDRRGRLGAESDVGAGPVHLLHRPAAAEQLSWLTW